jgi:hypothetical protein
MFRRVSSACHPLLPSFLFGLLFDIEDGVSSFLRNVGGLLPDNKTLSSPDCNILPDISSLYHVVRPTFTRAWSVNVWVHGIEIVPITAATLFKAWTVFARSNIGVVLSNTIRGMDICSLVFCVCVAMSM